MDMSINTFENDRIPSIKKDLLGNDISMWNPQTDVIKTDCTPLLDANSTFCSDRFFRWAYSLNTARGLFLRGEDRSVSVKEDIGKGISFSYPRLIAKVNITFLR